MERDAHVRARARRPERRVGDDGLPGAPSAGDHHRAGGLLPRTRAARPLVRRARTPGGDGRRLLPPGSLPAARRGAHRRRGRGARADRAPWGSERGCLHVDGDVRIARRGQLPDDPQGDLLQAGPLLVSGGRSLIDGSDREGFSAGAGQFDSDITVGRYPRCALGLSDTELLAVCCDGRRSGVDGGLTSASSPGSSSRSARRMRSTSTEAAPRRSFTAGICSTGPTRTRISPPRVAGRGHRAGVRVVSRASSCS